MATNGNVTKTACPLLASEEPDILCISLPSQDESGGKYDGTGELMVLRAIHHRHEEKSKRRRK